MKIIVTGSRDWEDYTHIWKSLYVFTAYDEDPLVLVHGNCATGADAMADDWGKLNLPGECIWRYPANWGAFGRAAGPMRNQLMLRAHSDADFVLAFPLGASQGTRGCMRSASETGLTVINLGER
ncbi:SLOG family protein [Actinomadura oligospora]|uniref:SLOG family protein n=1 Tax=Actinomadura oligospora TaxID=111804 RepID=UPI000478B480